VFQLSELQLPDFEYLALIAPFEKTETGSNYQLAFASIAFMRSFIALAFGKLPFYAPVAEFDFAESGEIAVTGDAVRMPLH
jgi:hypothetical protein